MAAVNVCNFFKYGFCKYLDKCKHKHEKTECEKEACEIKTCSFRHPKACRYFKEFRRCKFGDYCFYSHDKNGEESEVAELRNKVEFLDEQMEKNLETIENLNTTNGLQSVRINDLIKEMKKKDSEIADLMNEVRTVAKDLKLIQNVLSQPPSKAATTTTTSVESASVNTSQVDHTVECCNHRCCPGRGDHNRPPDKSQCCYHRCKKFPHYVQRKPEKM